ncbi:MAG: TVP38/TMEM64 family protein [Ruminococcaceae bacterium]|nr:TVP38/TMEM64 family protein [Oscillospiraceae bacterium]
MKKNFDKNQKLVAALAIAIFVLVMAFLAWIIGGPVLRFVGEPEKFRLWVERTGAMAPLAYAGVVIAQILVAFIPGEPLEIAGGYAFGAVGGTLLCLAAASVGSVLVFALVRRFGVKLFEVFFPIEKLRSLRFLRASKRRDLLFLIIFMIPGTPKDILCYFAGLTDIRFGVWLIICSLGRLPSIITSTLGGNALGTEKYILAAVVFAATLTVSGIGLAVYKKFGREEEGK